MNPWGHDLVVELWQWDISALWHLLLSISIYLFNSRKCVSTEAEASKHFASRKLQFGKYSSNEG